MQTPDSPGVGSAAATVPNASTPVDEADTPTAEPNVSAGKGVPTPPLSVSSTTRVAELVPPKGLPPTATDTAAAAGAHVTSTTNEATERSGIQDLASAALQQHQEQVSEQRERLADADVEASAAKFAYSGGPASNAADERSAQQSLSTNAGDVVADGRQKQGAVQPSLKPGLGAAMPILTSTTRAAEPSKTELAPNKMTVPKAGTMMETDGPMIDTNPADTGVSETSTKIAAPGSINMDLDDKANTAVGDAQNPASENIDNIAPIDAEAAAKAKTDDAADAIVALMAGPTKAVVDANKEAQAIIANFVGKDQTLGKTTRNGASATASAEPPEDETTPMETDESTPVEADSKTANDQSSTEDPAADRDTAEKSLSDTSAPKKVGAGETRNGDSNDNDDDTGSEAGRPDSSYSTRGKATSGKHDNDKTDSRGGRENLDDIPRSTEATAAPGVSFLESLTEEERRTRTRFLPDVDGMHALRRHEVKDDLHLARTLLGEDGPHKSKQKTPRALETPDFMQVEGGESPLHSEAESDVARTGSQAIELAPGQLMVPSASFLAPPTLPAGVSPEMIDDTTGDNTPVDTVPPFVVESVTAFNPPRPPESVGTKMKHRMLRWERRPGDIETDIQNYRKTVQRTCQELDKASIQKQRLETLSAHLRRHFLEHLGSLNEEYHLLNSAFATTQQECISAATALGLEASKGVQPTDIATMKDAVRALKSVVVKSSDSNKHNSLDGKGVDGLSSEMTETRRAGFGGLSHGAFLDWNRNSKFDSVPLSSAWVLVGDSVTTPFGDGVVKSVEYPTLKDAGLKEDKNESDKLSLTNGHGRKDSDKKTWEVTTPRIIVTLGRGTGYFPSKSVRLKDDPSTFSDERLAQRWNALLDSARKVGPYLDIEAVQSAHALVGNKAVNINTRDEMVGAATKEQVDGDDVASQGSGLPDEVGSSKHGVLRKTTNKYVPFASELLPTSAGRGVFLDKLDISDIESAVQSALFDGEGVLGMKSNLGVTSEIRDWEDRARECVVLKAEVSQQRNALTRQRRIRMLNERTFAATKERARRMENLVNEMRSDLSSLKRRLDDELGELGIDKKQACMILAGHYRAQHPERFDEGEDGPEGETEKGNKRQRTGPAEASADGDRTATTGSRPAAPASASAAETAAAAAAATAMI